MESRVALDNLFDQQNGLLVLKGPLVHLRRHLDAVFCSWAKHVHAEEYSFPPVLPVAALAAADYFSSFPHLATLATRIAPSEQGVARFVQASKNTMLENIPTQHLAPAQFVLPSAACYAVYHHLRGQQVQEARYITLMSPCFRHEDRYAAGQRQWAFHMREIVCIGDEDAVRKFLTTYRELIADRLREAGLAVTLSEATDPFFDKRDPRRLMQRLEPLKHEFLWNGSLAIASVNSHKTFFGERFGIKQPAGEFAFTGCVAFGLERWLYACLHEFGDDLTRWPSCLSTMI